MNVGGILELPYTSVRDVRKFGARALGTARDDAPYIQAAIDDASAAGGGVVDLGAGHYGISQITLKPGVLLKGVSVLPNPGGANVTRLTALQSGTMIETPASPKLRGAGISGVYLHGRDTLYPGRGIHVHDAFQCTFSDIVLNNWADEGLLGDASVGACHFERIFTQNCLMDRDREARAGAVDLAGHDNFIRDCEFNTSSLSLSSEDMNCVALVLRGANGMVSNCVTEISDIGLWLPFGAVYNKFSCFRADLNWGHGILIESSGNQFTSSAALRNGRAENNTYSGVHLSLTALGNQFAAFRSGGQSGDANRPKYGWEDLVNTNDANANQYAACAGNENATARFYTVTS